MVSRGRLQPTPLTPAPPGVLTILPPSSSAAATAASLRVVMCAGSSATRRAHDSASATWESSLTSASVSWSDRRACLACCHSAPPHDAGSPQGVLQCCGCEHSRHPASSHGSTRSPRPAPLRHSRSPRRMSGRRGGCPPRSAEAATLAPHYRVQPSKPSVAVMRRDEGMQGCVRSLLRPPQPTPTHILV